MDDISPKALAILDLIGAGATQQELANKAGCSTRTIQRRLCELLDAGLISSTGQRGQATAVYSVLSEQRSDKEALVGTTDGTTFRQNGEATYRDGSIAAAAALRARELPEELAADAPDERFVLAYCRWFTDRQRDPGLQPIRTPVGFAKAQFADPIGCGWRIGRDGQWIAPPHSAQFESARRRDQAKQTRAERSAKEGRSRRAAMEAGDADQKRLLQRWAALSLGERSELLQAVRASASDERRRILPRTVSEAKATTIVQCLNLHDKRQQEVAGALNRRRRQYFDALPSAKQREIVDRIKRSSPLLLAAGGDGIDDNTELCLAVYAEVGRLMQGTGD